MEQVDVFCLLKFNKTLCPAVKCWHTMQYLLWHGRAEVKKSQGLIFFSAYSCWVLPCLLVVQQDIWKACWWSWSLRSAAAPTGLWASSPSSADPGSWFPAHHKMPASCHRWVKKIIIIKKFPNAFWRFLNAVISSVTFKSMVNITSSPRFM